MKSIRAFLLLFLLTTNLLSACLINQRTPPPTPQPAPLKLKLDLQCEERLQDAETKDGESALGKGVIITLDGKLDYDPSLASELDNISTHFEVYVTNQLRLIKYIPIPLYPSGTSTFKKEINWADGSSCDLGYSIIFYELGGGPIRHDGDFSDNGDSSLP